ncbi:hypothetical protein J6590_039718 [Homalodisca vitripennis]|nr:hypothetical protein J6590_039718 [Homalodisca vitripennis]
MILIADLHTEGSLEKSSNFRVILVLSATPFSAQSPGPMKEWVKKIAMRTRRGDGCYKATPGSGKANCMLQVSPLGEGRKEQLKTEN